MSVTVPIDSAIEEVEIELDELPPGIGMLVVTRGPNSGSKFALDEPLVTAGRHPDSVIFLDDITVSRRHAEVRRTDGRLRGRRRGVAERHLPEPRAGGVSADSAMATSSRSAPSSCSSSRVDRDVRHGRPLPPVDRRGAQPPAGRLPRRHHLEDPVPREPGAARPRAHAVGLPEVLRRRHRAAPLDPPPPARPLPAPEGHEGPARGGRRGGPRRAAGRAAGRRRKSGTPSLFEHSTADAPEPAAEPEAPVPAAATKAPARDTRGLVGLRAGQRVPRPPCRSSRCGHRSTRSTAVPRA